MIIQDEKERKTILQKFLTYKKSYPFSQIVNKKKGFKIDLIDLRMFEKKWSERRIGKMKGVW